jgi:hypothetical protein
MSKKLNIGAITNELFEGSAFFRPAQKPEEGKVPSPAPIKREEPAEKPVPDQKKPKATAPTHTPPLIRRTFDLFEDQLEYLTRESLENRLAGKEGSMNAMLREALDNWIKNRVTSCQSGARGRGFSNHGYAGRCSGPGACGG